MTERVIERLFARAVVGPLQPHMETPCIVWDGCLDRYGYGKITLRRPDGVWRPEKVHRVAYRLILDEDPVLDLDHRCRLRSCFNPFHLEPVTNAENTRRGCGRGARGSDTHCARGHLFDEANTIVTIRASGTVKRECRICRTDRRKA